MGVTELGISWYEDEKTGKPTLDCRFIGAGFGCKMEIDSSVFKRIEQIGARRFREGFAHLFMAILEKSGSGLADWNVRRCMPLALEGVLKGA